MTTYTHTTQQSAGELHCFAATWPPSPADIEQAGKELHTRAAELQKAPAYTLILGPNTHNPREMVASLAMPPFTTMADLALQRCLTDIRTAVGANTPGLDAALITFGAGLKAYAARADQLSL